MNHVPDQRELNAFVDAELELTRQLEIESLAGREPAVRAQLERLQGMRQAIRRHGAYHAAPAALRDRVAALLPKDTAPQPGPRPAPQPRWFAWPSFAGGIAVAVLALAIVQWSWLAPSGDERVEDEVLASHARAVVSQRLVDVASSEHHTIKPWFSERLDFSPPVDAPAGTDTLGARVDYIDGRPVAALVMRRAGHLVDSFVWPASGADTAVTLDAKRGFNIARWSSRGMRHWVISDVNRQEFEALVRGLRAVE
jgi:anti-sigma factor RsiW